MKSILFVFCVVASLGVAATRLEAAVKGEPASNSGEVLRSTGQIEAPAGTPTHEIQEIERKMDAYKTGDNLSPEDNIANTKIKNEILHGTFDLRELCRLSLDKHWTTLSALAQNEFVDLMTRLLEAKAIFSKEQSKTRGKSYEVQYLGDVYLSDKTQAATRTRIVVAKENVQLDIEYKLKKNGKDWKIYDVVVDNASLVENYRYQFNEIIGQKGYAELLRRMRTKLKALNEKAG